MAKKGNLTIFLGRRQDKIHNQTTIKMTRRKGSSEHNRCEKYKSSKPSIQIETDIILMRFNKINDHQCADMEQHKEQRTMNKPL